jgi:hypothetical protein
VNVRASAMASIGSVLSCMQILHSDVTLALINSLGNKHQQKKCNTRLSIISESMPTLPTGQVRRKMEP